MAANCCMPRPQAQLVVLAVQVWWTEELEAALGGGSPAAALPAVLQRVEQMLAMLADSVLQDQPALRRVKLEHLINEFVHKRTVTRALVKSKVGASGGMGR